MITPVLAMLLALIGPTQESLVELSVGREGQHLLRYDGDALEALPVTHESTLLVRIADVTASDVGTFYDLRFIGTRPGTYDLADGLRHLDGRRVNDAEPMPITVTSVLPADHQGDLEPLTPPPAPGGNGFRVLVSLAIVAWLIPLVVAIRRRIRERATVAPVSKTSDAEPTFADQLRPLVEAAARSELSLDEKVHLERLLIAHWRADEARPADEDHATTMRRLRDDDDVGPLLSGVERWLHGPPTRADVDVGALLAPFRAAPAVRDVAEAPS